MDKFRHTVAKGDMSYPSYSINTVNIYEVNNCCIIYFVMYNTAVIDLILEYIDPQSWCSLWAEALKQYQGLGLIYSSIQSITYKYVQRIWPNANELQCIEDLYSKFFSKITNLSTSLKKSGQPLDFIFKNFRKSFLTHHTEWICYIFITFDVIIYYIWKLKYYTSVNIHWKCLLGNWIR